MWIATRPALPLPFSPQEPNKERVTLSSERQLGLALVNFQATSVFYACYCTYFGGIYFV